MCYFSSFVFQSFKLRPTLSVPFRNSTSWAAASWWVNVTFKSPLPSASRRVWIKLLSDCFIMFLSLCGIDRSRGCSLSCNALDFATLSLLIFRLTTKWMNKGKISFCEYYFFILFQFPLLLYRNIVVDDLFFYWSCFKKVYQIYFLTNYPTW